MGFRTTRHLSFNIYAMNPTGQANLTNYMAADFEPDWSPDGNQDRVPDDPGRE